MAIQIRDHASDDPEVMVEMNTTPLIDVMLVLLVMLIITIPIQLNAVNIELPLGRDTQTTEPRVVRIDVTAAGQMLWNGEPVADQAALATRLQAAAVEAVQPEIHVRPQPRAKYDTVAAVLAMSQRAGLLKIGLVGQEPARR